MSDTPHKPMPNLVVQIQQAPITVQRRGRVVPLRLLVRLRLATRVPARGGADEGPRALTPLGPPQHATLLVSFGTGKRVARMVTHGSVAVRWRPQTHGRAEQGRRDHRPAAAATTTATAASARRRRRLRPGHVLGRQRLAPLGQRASGAENANDQAARRLRIDLFKQSPRRASMLGRTSLLVCFGPALCGTQQLRQAKQRDAYARCSGHRSAPAAPVRDVERDVHCALPHLLCSLISGSASASDDFGESDGKLQRGLECSTVTVHGVSPRSRDVTLAAPGRGETGP